MLHGLYGMSQCKSSPCNMTVTYLAAIKAKCAVLGLNLSPLEDKRITYHDRSLKLHRPMSKTNVTLREKIVYQCDSIYMGGILKQFFWLLFRLSNLAPTLFQLLILPGISLEYYCF